MVFQIPLYLIVPTIYLFIVIKLSFFAAIGVIIIGVLVNIAIGVKASRNWDSMLMAKDKRMNIMTQTINNIKLLKLYSWTESF